MDDGVPWEVRVSLRAGSVYYFVDRQLTSPEPHYFIVLNVRPLQQKILILGIIISKVEKVRQRRADLPQTVVLISPSDYQELSKPSVVDANVVIRKSLAELVAKIKRREVVYKSDLPKHLLIAIQKAVLASPLVEQEIKDLLF